MEAKNEKSINNEYVYTLHDAMDNGKQHIPYSEEMSFYDLVKSGDIDRLKEMNPKLLVEGQGVLSNDKVRNARYHFIIATAFITRFCIEGGMQKEEAYTLSDVYIRKMDRLSELESIEKLHHEMVFGFAEKMKELRKTSASSTHIRRAIDYISSHLNVQIRIRDISEHLSISEKYLSALFKKETGMSIVAYIEQRQMEAACQMLTYSDFTYAEIADNLAYCSQSYFSKIFKKYYGMTPMQYRMKYNNEKFLK
ncbi:MAG: AraC family transcriptional regulator [Treponema sp.]|nr:AraC family transcriptional regulator [Candidatus Treponema equifaecale]